MSLKKNRHTLERKNEILTFIFTPIEQTYLWMVKTMIGSNVSYGEALSGYWILYSLCYRPLL